MSRRNLVKSADSPSLWNCTLSPGWKREESQVLRLALMKFGVGRWNKIIESGCLPGKTPAQLCLQTQRLLGQQSIGGKLLFIIRNLIITELIIVCALKYAHTLLTK